MNAAKRYNKLYQRAWREGLRKALLAGEVSLSHVVNGERVALDPKYYRALECYPPPLETQASRRHRNEPESDPIFVLDDKPLHAPLIHPLTTAAEAMLRKRR